MKLANHTSNCSVVLDEKMYLTQEESTRQGFKLGCISVIIESSRQVCREIRVSEPTLPQQERQRGREANVWVSLSIH